MRFPTVEPYDQSQMVSDAVNPALPIEQRLRIIATITWPKAQLDSADDHLQQTLLEAADRIAASPPTVMGQGGAEPID